MKNPEPAAQPKPTQHCEFIAKLLGMMKQFPQAVQWSLDGQHVLFADLDSLRQQILPKYFRHRNILSFVRQLNMYYFSKVEEPGHNSMRFKHAVFFRGNDQHYGEIGRRNKTRDVIVGSLEKNEVWQILENDNKLPMSTKNLIKAGLQYHSIALKSLKKVKSALEELTGKMKSARSQKTKSCLQHLTAQSLPTLASLIECCKSQEPFIKQELLRDLTYGQPSVESLSNAQSQLMLFDQPRTIKDMEVSQLMFNQPSNYSIMQFISESDGNGREEGMLAFGENEDISLGRDLKDDHEEG